jgi:predicted RNA binding protein YcfA (HicA-like mRNA interferase family)
MTFINEVTKLMESEGFQLQRTKRHMVWRHYTGVMINTSKTPSGCNAINQIKREIRRKLTF